MMHLTGKAVWRMQGWLRRGQVKTALMSCDNVERRYVRADAVLGGALSTVVVRTGDDCCEADVERNFGLG